MDKDQDFQYIVFWSIAGPVILVLSLFLIGKFLLNLAPTNSDSWAIGVGSVLYYSSRLAAVLVAHVLAFFGALGLLALPWRQVKHKALTLITCAAAVFASVPLLAALYFKYQLWPFNL